MRTDVEVALAPEATYERLAHAHAAGSMRALLGRLLLALAIIGTSVSVAATGRVSLELVVTIAVSWSFALLVQALAAAAVILPAAGRTVSTLRAFELWFRAHVPWSLWFLLPVLFFALAGRRVNDTVLVTFVLVPAVWTVVLLRAFARHVLQSRRVGLVTVVHQAVLWGLTLCYIAFAIGGWDRVLDEVGL